MTRYLVLEVTDEQDPDYLLDTMRQHADGEATLVACTCGLALNVTIPPRPLVIRMAMDNDPHDPRQLYIEEAR